MSNRFLVKKNILDIEYNQLLSGLTTSAVIYATFVISVSVTLMQRAVQLNSLQTFIVFSVPTLLFSTAMLVLANGLKRKKAQISNLC